MIYVIIFLLLTLIIIALIWKPIQFVLGPNDRNNLKRFRANWRTPSIDTYEDENGLIPMRNREVMCVSGISAAPLDIKNGTVVIVDKISDSTSLRQGDVVIVLAEDVHRIRKVHKIENDTVFFEGDSSNIELPLGSPQIIGLVSYRSYDVLN